MKQPSLFLMRGRNIEFRRFPLRGIGIFGGGFDLFVRHIRSPRLPGGFIVWVFPGELEFAQDLPVVAAQGVQFGQVGEGLALGLFCVRQFLGLAFD